jgi:hypothetical protein
MQVPTDIDHSERGACRAGARRRRNNARRGPRAACRDAQRATATRRVASFVRIRRSERALRPRFDGTPDASPEIVRPVGLAIVTSVGVAGAGFAPTQATPRSDFEIPRGSVELTSFGTVDLSPDQGAPIHTMHVRMIVSNKTDDRPWTVDASQSRLEIGDANIAATAARSDVDTLPFAIVARGERAVIDCFFALPATIADTPTPFTVAWTLRTPDSATPEHTRFTVDEARKSRAASALPTDRRGRWWFDRAYPWPSFYRNSGILAHRPPTRVAIVRNPAIHDRRNTEESAPLPE